MPIFNQGEEFAINVTVKDKETGDVITSTGVTGAICQIGTGTNKVTKEYPDGGLSYDSTNEVWTFRLTQAQTYAFPVGTALFQAQFRFSNGDILDCPVTDLGVLRSIVTKVWTDEQS